MNAAKDDVSRKSGYAFNQIRIDPGNANRIFVTGSSIASSEDGGKTWAGLGAGPQENRVFRRAFGDFRTLWIDPANPERMIAGSDGGVFVSYDGGRSCDHLANLPLGEVYALTVDSEQPYNVYAGLQDHESWKGPSNGWSGSVGLADWVTVGTGDGMYNQVDPTDSRWLYNNQEFGRHARLDQKLRVRQTIQPTRPPGQPPLRFNWTSPLLLSPHDPRTLYAGAQVLFRSLDRGDRWQEISPDLTTNDPTKISAPGGSIQFCTITTIAESPMTAGVIWVGSDDGKVQLTRDGGATWSDRTREIAQAGGPEDAWVSRVLASRFEPGTAYVSKSRRRQDDPRAFLYKTTDFGATWASAASNLPAWPVNVVFEDHEKPELLFAGNDTGVFVSLDGGLRWSALRGNMPAAAVHDLLVHPRDGDLVVGTYGRGIWIADMTPLRELNEEILDKDVHFFATPPTGGRREGALGNYRLYGDRHVVTPNQPNGLDFTYYLKQDASGPVTLTAADLDGTVLGTLEASAKAGINRVTWELGEPRRRPPAAGGAARQTVRPLPPGECLVTLQAGAAKLTQKVRVLPDVIPAVQ